MTTGGVLEVPGVVQALWFRLPGVRSKSNFRRDSDRATWRSLTAFEDDVALTAREHRPATWPMGDHADAVTARPWVLSYVFAKTLLDSGNISKSVLDAVEKVLYLNDASVRSTLSTTRRSRESTGFAAFAIVEPCSEPQLAALQASLAAYAHGAADTA